MISISRKILGLSASAALVSLFASSTFAQGSDQRFVQSPNGQVSVANKETFGAKRYNIGIQPVYLLVSGVGANFDYLTSEKVSFGVSGIYVGRHLNERASSERDSEDTYGRKSLNRYYWEHQELAIGSNLMLTGSLISDGVYVSPSIGYMSTKITEYSEYNLSGSANSPFFRITGGYLWSGPTGFNVAIGAGLKSASNARVKIYDNDGKEVYSTSASITGLTLELKFGYLF